MRGHETPGNHSLAILKGFSTVSPVVNEIALCLLAEDFIRNPHAGELRISARYSHLFPPDTGLKFGDLCPFSSSEAVEKVPEQALG